MMHIKTPNAAVITLICCAAFALPASAQMPWQSAPQPYPAQGQPYPPQPYPPQPYPAQGYPPQGQPYPAQGQMPPEYYPPQGGVAPAPYAPSSPGEARSTDDRQLDFLATKFYHISPRDPRAIEKLERLGREVHDYRANLGYHGYDARDILKDAKKLEWRINHQREKLEAASQQNQYGNSGPAPGPHVVQSAPPVSAPYAMPAAPPPPAIAPAPPPATDGSYAPTAR